MSLLQPILEQWHHERRTSHRDGSAIAELADGDDAAGREIEAPIVPGLRSSPLGRHASRYRENLGQCSEPMLQYEWGWMNGRLEALQEFRSGGLAPAGEGEGASSQDAFQELLAEAQLFLTLLLQEFAARGVPPAASRPRENP